MCMCMMCYGFVFCLLGDCFNVVGWYDLGIIIDGSGSVGNYEFV